MEFNLLMIVMIYLIFVCIVNMSVTLRVPVVCNVGGRMTDGDVWAQLVSVTDIESEPIQLAKTKTTIGRNQGLVYCFYIFKYLKVSVICGVYAFMSSFYSPNAGSILSRDITARFFFATGRHYFRTGFSQFSY